MVQLFSRSPERQLWCAVVERAMQDAVGCNAAMADREVRRRERQDALNWFLEGGRDYQLACDAAGVDPDHLRHRVLTLAAKSEEGASGSLRAAAD
jgi:hypothetical protein